MEKDRLGAAYAKAGINKTVKELEELKFVAEYPREFLLAYFKNLKQKLEIIMQSSIRPFINKELYLERMGILQD